MHKKNKYWQLFLSTFKLSACTFAQKICNAADVFHQTSRVFECIGIDFLQDVAFCPLPRRYRDGIRLVNMSFAIRNRL